MIRVYKNMQQIKFLSAKERQEIIEKLKNQFGIENVNGEFILSGTDRIFLYQGSLKQEEITQIQKRTIIERIGIYFAKKINDEIKLSLDGVQISREKIKKNIFEINKKQADDWMSGKELLIETGLRGFMILKYENNFLGCGKASEGKITNFVPKSRRLKYKEN